MRILGDIIEDCKSGGRPDYDELRYGLLALSAMLIIDHNKLREVLIGEPKHDFVKKMLADNSSNMYQTALSKPPKDWLGWGHDPDNPEYQRCRAAAGKVLDKVIRDMKGKRDEAKVDDEEGQ